ncbi:hypothetical protein [Arachidicoccus soli]|uniref:Uncharacterized protein n=1 Tax=Arachidicoccus soli TaxID=2341117 RepID=A0A386HPL8_9BACT|nr:hypothetical protein [Arachidicoccus soli]AYD47785.1 hypothetical protein D6B99_09385 [Arachidicoccus soli]
MTNIVSQIISLVGYGNDYLYNGTLPVDFYPEHPAFQFCKKVDFIDLKGNATPLSSQNETVAENPLEWMIYLKYKGCKNLRLYFQYSGDENFPDYKSAGMVGGGGYWRIEANYGSNCDIWASRWEVNSKDDSGKNIWSVTYGLLAKDQQPTNLHCDLSIIKNVTKKRLSAISNFAAKQQLKNWHQIFENALAVLENPESADSDFLHLMIPKEKYSLLARQIMFTAYAAWVFGGIGSWNDLFFKDGNTQDCYEQLSYNLYDNICVNIIASLNSY